MARYKTLLVPHRVAVAGRKRKCFHSPEHHVIKGDIVLEVKKQRSWSGYCLPCAREMIRLAQEQLRTAEQGL